MALLESQMLPTKSVPFGPATGKAGWRHMHAVQGVQEGVYGQSHMRAAQRVAGGAGLFVDIAPGDAWVQGDDTARQGLYHEHNDAVVTLPTPANASGSPRFDQLILRVPDSSIAGGTDIPTYEVLQGTPNGATNIDNRLGAASLPNGCFRIAEWVSPNAYTQVTNAMIRDRRTYALGARHRYEMDAGGDYTTASASLVAIDAANMVPRIECTGRPIKVSLNDELYTSIVGTTGPVTLAVLVDAAGLTPALRRGRFYATTAGLPAGSGKLVDLELTPTPGTHTIGLYWNVGGGATATLKRDANFGGTFVVEEVDQIRNNV